MPPRPRYTSGALHDLAEIGGYIAKDNKREAERFINRIKDKCREIAASSEMGRLREAFGSGVRTFPVGNYLIFYKPTRSGVIVLRIIHGARNLLEAFGPEG
ncbi:MAG: type II toxin-antitoxin system RelE/ParE family toxin [Magnetospirillum sp. WYHS-4]